MNHDPSRFDASAETSLRHDAVALGLGLLTLVAANASVAVSQIALGLLLLALLIRGLQHRRRPQVTGLEKTTALLIAWALFTIPFSTAPGESLVFFKRFYLFAAIWAFASLAGDERRRRLLLTALAVGASAMGIVGLVDIARRSGGLFRIRLEQVSNPMTSGALLMMVLLVLLGMTLVRGRSRIARAWLLAAALPVFVALLHTMTRSALLGLVSGAGLMLALARPRLALWSSALLAALVVVTITFGESFLTPRLYGRLDPAYVLQGDNTKARFEMWRGGWAMVKARPWTGFGDRDLNAVAPDYYGDTTTRYFGHLHSNPVQLAVIWGLPGLALAMAFLVAHMVLLIRHWRRLGAGAGRAPPWLAGWLLGAAGVWVGFFVAGLTEWYFGDAEPMLIYLTVMGIALGGAVATASPAQPVNGSSYD